MALPTATTPLSQGHDTAHTAMVDVRAYFAATGDGTTDDTAAFQAAHDAMSPGETLYVPPTASGYKLTDAIDISTSINVVSDGAQMWQSVAGKKVFDVTASNVTIGGLWLRGRGNAALTVLEYAIHVHGTDGTAPVSNINIHDCRLEEWGFYGALLEYVTDFDVSRNHIASVGYAGIAVLSGIQGRVGENRISDISPGGVNAYGMILSINGGGNLITDPLTADVVVTGNQVSGVPLWEGIDTHGGQRISFVGNTVYGCKYGIAVGTAANWAPKDCSVVGNTIDSGETDGSASSGIAFTGAPGSLGSPVECATGTIVGNTILGHGDETNALDGGIYMHDTQGVAVVGNHLMMPSPHGINAYHDNYGLAVAGNTVTDSWSNTGGVGESCGIRFSSDYNTATVGNNAWRRDGLVGPTYILTTGIKVQSGTGSDVVQSGNYSDATVHFADVSGLAVLKGWDHNGGFAAEARNDQNAATQVKTENKIALGNTTASAQMVVEALTASGYIGAFPSDYGVSGVADGMVLGANSDAAGIVLYATGASQTIRLYAGGTSVAVVIDASGNLTIKNDLDHDGSRVGFYGTAPILKQTGIPVSAAGIHAALVNLGLIT